MQQATAEATMAKKKSDGAEPPTKAVKIDRALATKAQMIATDRGISLADYISDALRGAVEKDWGKMIRRVGGTTEGGSK
jgi:predicted HicB family RNase H-like nuclease